MSKKRYSLYFSIIFTVCRILQRGSGTDAEQDLLLGNGLPDAGTQREGYPAGGEFSKTVSIKFDGEKVSYSKANGVGISTDKGHVTVTSTAEDVKFVLSGKSDAGSLSLESSHRCMIQLDGVELASSGGPAIEITSKKRTFIQAVGASVLSSDSATVHSHGELTFTGGTFTLKSSDSHTIACSQHIAVLDGTFNLEAAGDGFHAKKMFVMNDGSVNVTAGSNGGFGNNLHFSGSNQSDINFGLTAAMAESLLQSHAGEISILPALLTGWKEGGSVSGLKAHGGYEVSISWKDGQLVTCTIKSVLGHPFTVRYGDKTREISLPAGQSVTLDSNLR